MLAGATYAPGGGALSLNLGNSTVETYGYSPRWITGMTLVGNGTGGGTSSSGSITLSGSEQSIAAGAGATPSTGTISFGGSDGFVRVCSGSPGHFVCQFNSDTGSISVTINDSFTATISYDGSSSYASMAQALADAFNVPGSPVSAPSDNMGLESVTLTSIAVGPDTNYSISISTDEGGSDYDVYDDGPTMTGGSGGSNGSGTTFDAGTITASLGYPSCEGGSSQIAVPYGSGSTLASITTALASALQANYSCIIAVSTNGSTLNLTSAGSGSETNWPLTVSVSYDQVHFGQSSFTAYTTGMLGGSDPGNSGTATLYTYSVQHHAPNGQITQVSDSANGVWNHTYDELNRLKTSSGSTASLSWDYDRYGNRWNQNVVNGTAYSSSVTFDQTTNRASSNLTYDAAGNVRNDTLHNYVYDSENRIFQVDGGIQYIYDAEGRRVGKSDGTLYVVDPAGAVLDEFSGATWKRSEVNVGRHLATVTPAGTYFPHSDWLGTERARTDSTGRLCQLNASLPYGESVGAPALMTGDVACNPTPAFLTGKERDPETGLDDFGARYLSSHWGRWMSPDWSGSPVGVPYANLANPQSMNLYAYVGNDPVNGEDADGHSSYHFGDETLDNGDGMLLRDFNEFRDSSEPASSASNAGVHNPWTDHLHSGKLIDNDLSEGDNFYGEKPSSGYPAERQLTITLNLGGVNVTINFAYGNIFSADRGGVDIIATPQGCADCMWGQAVSRTGAGSTSLMKDGPGQGPLYGPQGGPANQFQDRPTTPKGGKGTFTGIAVLGHLNLGAKQFFTQGAFTYGYRADGNGGIRLTIGPRVATRSEQASAVQILSKASPGWQVK